MLVIALYLGRMCRIGIDLVWVDVEKILIVMAMIFLKLLISVPILRMKSVIVNIDSLFV